MKDNFIKEAGSLDMHDLRILLRIEFKRAFKSKAFYICLAIGIALAAGSFINKAVPHMDVLKGFTGNAASYPFSVYNSWMGNFVGYEPFATAYLYVCMLYSALPYCGFFVRDNKNQYILQYYSRMSKNKVHAAKFITTFVIGGMLVSLPVLINLIATMMFIPALPPVENGLFIGTGKSIMSNLFCDHTMIYVLIYIVQFFIYGGAFSVVSLAVSFTFNNVFLVIVSPFVAYYGVGVISTLSKNYLGITSFNPMVYLSPSYLLPNKALIGFILEPLIIIGVSMLIFFRKGAENEAL